MTSGPPLECFEISSRQVEIEPLHGLSMEEARCFGGRLTLGQSQQNARIFSFIFSGTPKSSPQRVPARAFLATCQSQTGRGLQAPKFPTTRSFGAENSRKSHKRSNSPEPKELVPGNKAPQWHPSASSVDHHKRGLDSNRPSLLPRNLSQPKTRENRIFGPTLSPRFESTQHIPAGRRQAPVRPAGVPPTLPTACPKKERRAAT